MLLSAQPAGKTARDHAYVNLSSRSSSGGSGSSSWVDEFAVVELGRRSLVGFGQCEAEAHSWLRLLDFGVASFSVPEGTSATSWPQRSHTSTSIFPKSHVDGLIFAAALLVELRCLRRAAEGRDSHEGDFPRLCHLTAAVRRLGMRKRDAVRYSSESPLEGRLLPPPGDGRRLKLASEEMLASSHWVLRATQWLLSPSGPYQSIY